MYAKTRKSIVRPVIRAQERIDRLSKKRTYKSGSELTRWGSCLESMECSRICYTEKVIKNNNLFCSDININIFAIHMRKVLSGKR